MGGKMDVKLTDKAAEGLDRLPLRIHTRVQEKVELLRNWPEVSGAKPLSGNLAGYYRLRTGDYRIQFRIEEGTVIVSRIGHRDKFYKD
jgi:mRNA interferase RelE/StbE